MLMLAEMQGEPGPSLKLALIMAVLKNSSSSNSVMSRGRLPTYTFRCCSERQENDEGEDS